MTKALEEAFEAVAKLPAEEQDAIAALVRAELASEEQWERTFAKSQDALAKLADAALEEHRAGKSEALDPDAT